MDWEGRPATAWESMNAWPSSLTIKAESGSKPVEEVVISHEGVMVRKQ
jgi:hypothetical protein